MPPRVRDAGFRWDGKDKVWKLEMEEGEKWRAHRDAENVFKDIGNSIRAKAGLEPVGQGFGIPD
jgi:hypothetical protein